MPGTQQVRAGGWPSLPMIIITTNEKQSPEDGVLPTAKQPSQK